MAPPTARFQLAFDEPDPAAGELRWQAEPTWTDMDDELRISEYSIDRGRSFELDRVDTGRATILINDTEGVLDPTNPGGPHSGDILPLIQARLALWNPSSRIGIPASGGSWRATSTSSTPRNWSIA